MGELFSSDNVDQYIRFASNHQIMVMIFVVLFVALIYFQVRIMLANVKKISANNATAMVNHEDGVFVDVRANKLFTSGHIAGSINITLAEIKEQLDSRFVQTHKSCIINKDYIVSKNYSKGYVDLSTGLRLFCLSRNFKDEVER